MQKAERVTNDRSSRGRVLVAVLGVFLVVFAPASAPPRVAAAAPSGSPPYAWTTQHVDTAGDTGWYTSIALDANGTPYVAYVDNTNGTVRVAHRVGSSWRSEPVTGSGSYLGQTSIAVAPNGTVELTYFDAFYNQVKFAVRGPQGWNTSVVDAGYSDGYDRLALDAQGRPSVVYASSNGLLRYAAWNGTAWQRETVDAVTIISRYPDLTLDSQGHPVIAYYGDGYLRYAAKIAGRWFLERVDPTVYAGLFARVRFDAGQVPHIAYYDSANGSVRYATLENGTWSHVVVDNQGDAGWDLSFIVDDLGRSQLAYYTRNPGILRYAILNNGVWIKETVDTSGIVGWYTGIAADASGFPHISYYDVTDGDLKYAEGSVALQVRTLGAVPVTSTSATLQGELVALGNHSAVTVGFSVQTMGTAGAYQVSAGTVTSAGIFSARLTNLTMNQVYTVRAEASSGNETATGILWTFRTPTPPAPPVLFYAVVASLLAAVGVGTTAVVLWYRRRKTKAAPRPEPGDDHSAR